MIIKIKNNKKRPRILGLNLFPTIHEGAGN